MQKSSKRNETIAMTLFLKMHFEEQNNCIRSEIIAIHTGTTQLFQVQLNCNSQYHKWSCHFTFTGKRNDLPIQEEVNFFML